MGGGKGNRKRLKIGAAPGAQGGDGAISGGGKARRGGVTVAVFGSSLTGREQLRRAGEHATGLAGPPPSGSVRRFSRARSA